MSGFFLNVYCCFCCLLFPFSAFAQYHDYADNGNLVGQSIIKTNDNGFWIAAVEYCYTPGSIAIEGCTFALHLVRTDANGDTIWTKREPTPYAGILHLYEADNGQLTIITTTNENYVCDNIFAGLFGFRQIKIFNFNPDGSLINKVNFPNNCELSMVDVTPVDDQTFAVLAYYRRPPFFNDPPEGRLFLMNNNGSIIKTLTFPGEKFNAGALIKNNAGELQVLYVENQAQLKLLTYDAQLNLLNTAVNTNIAGTNFLDFFPDVKAQLLQNGDLGVLCHVQFQQAESVQFFRLDQNLNILVNQLYSFKSPTNLVEHANGNIIIASSHPNGNINNTRINYLSPAGDSLYSTDIPYPETAEPTQIVWNNDNQLAITGALNCCNLDTSIGPARSFLLFTDVTTGINNLSPVADQVKVYPNPAQSQIIVEHAADLNHEPWSLVITSSTGSVVRKVQLNSPVITIPVDKFADGIYFYQLYDKGTLIKTGNFLKSN